MRVTDTTVTRCFSLLEWTTYDNAFIRGGLETTIANFRLIESSNQDDFKNSLLPLFIVLSFLKNK